MLPISWGLSREEAHLRNRWRYGRENQASGERTEHAVLNGIATRSTPDESEAMTSEHEKAS